MIFRMASLLDFDVRRDGCISVIMACAIQHSLRTCMQCMRTCICHPQLFSVLLLVLSFRLIEAWATANHGGFSTGRSHEHRVPHCHRMGLRFRVTAALTSPRCSTCLYTLPHKACLERDSTREVLGNRCLQHSQSSDCFDLQIYECHLLDVTPAFLLLVFRSLVCPQALSISSGPSYPGPYSCTHVRMHVCQCVTIFYLGVSMHYARRWSERATRIPTDDLRIVSTQSPHPSINPPAHRSIHRSGDPLIHRYLLAWFLPLSLCPFVLIIVGAIKPSILCTDAFRLSWLH